MDMLLYMQVDSGKVGRATFSDGMLQHLDKLKKEKNPKTEIWLEPDSLDNIAKSIEKVDVAIRGLYEVGQLCRGKWVSFRTESTPLHGTAERGRHRAVLLQGQVARSRTASVHPAVTPPQTLETASGPCPSRGTRRA